MERPEPDRIVDARARPCPIPVVEAARAARQGAVGEVLLVLASDPAAATDLPIWCDATGHEWLGLERDGRELRAYIRLRSGR